ncbi:hypothetical protein E2562_034390 [Oryza meyeriana var. granulata]|uniref:Uncharacterized protein n=1 Tax=Oryza meyeriana var. granulata TaxID=110450 RepID=A0A6G1CLN4_9ORYZ|nr:hypothetical protein E2562_034390 [Oryza meyeriana var. granulata]
MAASWRLVSGLPLALFPGRPPRLVASLAPRTPTRHADPICTVRSILPTLLSRPIPRARNSWTSLPRAHRTAWMRRAPRAAAMDAWSGDERLWWKSASWGGSGSHAGEGAHVATRRVVVTWEGGPRRARLCPSYLYGAV